MPQLIEAAEEIFLKSGYYTATMSDVAKAAGMSKKTVYQMIDSKAELFMLLLSHYKSLLVFPQPEPEWSLRDILVENLLCLGRFLFSTRQVAVLRLIMAEYIHSPDLTQLFHQKGVSKAKLQLETCLLAIPCCDGVKPADVREMGAMLFGMALAELQLGVLIGFRPMPSKVALRRRVEYAVDLFLSGCGALSRR